MRLSTTHAEGTRRSLGNRLVLGFAGIMMALAMSVGFAGSASALSTTTTPGNMPQNKAQCKQGGWKNFVDNQGKRLFKNQGQCVAAAVQMPGGGYGGICTNNSCNVNIDIDIDIDIIVIGNGNTIIIGFPPMN